MMILEPAPKAAVTAFFLVSFFLLACPFGARAAVAAHDLVKSASNSAVYYVDADGRRWVFPNQDIYRSWYPDFSAVKTVSDEELAAAPIGGAVKYRPGTRLVKITTDPKVYAVEPGGVLRWIRSESVASAVYGADWTRRVDDLPEAFFAGYAVGPQLDSARYPDGTVLKRRSDGAHFIIDGLFKRRLASSSLLKGLRVSDADVITANYAIDDFPDGLPLDSVESRLIDASQAGPPAEPPSAPAFWLSRPRANYIPIGSDAVILELHAFSASGAFLRQLSIRLDATTGAPSGSGDDTDKGGLVYMNSNLANLTAIRLVDGVGMEPFGRRELSTDTQRDQSQTVTFTGSYELPAGEERVLRLMAKVNSLLPANEGCRATVIRDSMTVTDAAGAPLAFAPVTDLVGQTLRSAESEMTVGVYAAGGNKTYVRGAESAELGGFQFWAPAASSPTVRSVTFRGYVDQAGRGGYVAGQDSDSGFPTTVRDIVPEVGLYDTKGNILAAPVEPTLDGRLVFTGLDFSVAAGSSFAVVLKGDLNPRLNVGEAEPTRLAFDISDASTEVSAVDENGVGVAVEGVEPNGGGKPHVVTTVRRLGKLKFTWQGSGGNAVAGDEIQLGQITLKAEYDGFVLRTVSFRQVGTASRSMFSARLSYPSGSATASVTKDFIGNNITFSGLPIAVERDKSVTVRLYASTLPKDGGAVYGEQVRVMFGSDDALEFVSASDGTAFSESSLGTYDFSLESNSASNWTIRFSSLKLSLSDLTPATCRRDSEFEVMRFTAESSPAGPVRIRRIAFKVTPSDAGRAGAGNDSLERWAAVNGDFYNDYSIVTLKQVGSPETTALGEDGSASVRYSVVSGGRENTAPVSSGYVSAPRDYAIIRYDFNQGSEMFIPAGSTVEFRLFLDTARFDSGATYKLDIGILGGGEFLWTDIVTGSYAPLTGSDAYGVTRSASLTCRT